MGCIIYMESYKTESLFSKLKKFAYCDCINAVNKIVLIHCGNVLKMAWWLITTIWSGIMTCTVSGTTIHSPADLYYAL